MSCLFYLFRVFPIKRNKIVFSSYLGLGYGDNGKYIVEELIKRKNKYDIVWLSRSLDNTFPAGVRQVLYKSIKSIFEQSTAKIWVDNRRKPLYIRKRRNQIYINTWHGYMGIKKLEQDVEQQLSSIYVKEAKHDSRMLDYFVSGSKWETECIRKVFWYKGKILEYGYPRSDILLQGFDSIKVRRKLGLAKEEKILLYAPTFRRSLDEDSFKVYYLEWDRVLDALSQRFGGHWTGMIRLHPNLSLISNKIHIPSEILNVSTYDDMQELIASCDCLITDYSSSILDAGIAEKIGFFYATDYEDYMKDRAVYFDIKKDLPFPFSVDVHGLLKNIESFDMIKYKRDLVEFFDNRYGVYRSGRASSAVCDIIDKYISEKSTNK